MLFKTIPLTKGMKAIVDPEDYDRISQFKWCVSKSRGQLRAIRSIRDGVRTRSILMSRFVMNCPENMVVDHINHNTLDNRKCNIRICTQSENMRNRSKINKGISKQGNKWRARITINNKTIHLGYFDLKSDAIEAYNNASPEHHGIFACNSIEGD